MKLRDVSLNTDLSLIMHIDLNSCFATTEQQARPLLRDRPVAVVNRRTFHTAIVTASYEAKARGVKMGMKVNEALKIAPDLIVVETDPQKYHFVYKKLLAIMRSYSPNVVMKSIDEGVIDFTDTYETINTGNLEDIGREIKQRLKDEVGSYMKCNIGIAPNRFLAKTAAGMDKPDGMTRIDHTNLYSQFAKLKLTDLTGIAHRNEAKLNAVGVKTPLDFLTLSEDALSQLVFKGKPGRDWYKRLRGYEVDAAPTKMGIVGRQYVLERRDLSREEILRRLHFLCQSTAEKLRFKNKQARGVIVFASPRRFTRGWAARHLAVEPFSSTEEIYEKVKALFVNAPASADIRIIGVTCYHLSELGSRQPRIWDIPFDHKEQLSQTIDTINSRYGSHSIQIADTLGLEKIMKQKIPFGSTRYFEMLGVVE